MDIETTAPARLPARISIVGPGRLGRALTRALSAAGVQVGGPTGRDVAPDPADAVLLCVPDAEIPSAAASAAGAARLIGHTSGATALASLDPAGAESFGLHPLQTFAGGEEAAAFRGAGCAVAGTTPAALGAAHAIAAALGMRAVQVDDSARAAYHAAASIASNFLVTLQASAEEMAGAAGLNPEDARALLAPLVRATVDNWAAGGPAAALTGPVARGDHATVALQREAVSEAAPHLLPLFDALVERTEALAGQEAVA